MSIATSIEKLSETLTNCKTNLKEKGVEADNIKISDVDEKIAEIQAGGGELKLNYLRFSNITGMKCCDLVIVDNNNFKIVVTVESQYENTQLYLLHSTGGGDPVALKKNSSTEFETENINIDEFVESHSDFDDPAFIHGSQYYDFESPKTKPFVDFDITQHN